MKRTICALAGTAAFGLSLAGAAQAAAPPTARTGRPTAVTNTTATLHARVYPHGVTTDVTFQYGPTPAYGGKTVGRSAGVHAKDISVPITGLSPGTVYHERVVAESVAGIYGGADVTFKTTGVAPSAVATGPASSVRKELATLTGTVVPGNASTLWQMQYGLTTAYGLQTQPGSLIASSVPDPVTFALSGLAPDHLFHYRLVAYHGPIGAASTVVTYGADATFFTMPNNPSPAKMTTKTTPSSDTRSPYAFTTSGKLNGGTEIPTAQRCSGTVAIRYYNGKRQLADTLVGVNSDCGFSGKVSFKKTRGPGSVALRVSVYYRGNGYLHSQSKTDHPHAGKPKPKKK